MAALRAQLHGEDTRRSPFETALISSLVNMNAGDGDESLGKQLRQLAEREIRADTRIRKHTSISQRGAVSEREWWQALLASVQLDSHLEHFKFI